jgi:hypothetical protein
LPTDDIGSDDPVPVRDRREHGGAPDRPDDEELARRTERERVAAGVEPYDPDDVPPATDTEPVVDPAEDEEFQEERGVFKRQVDEGLIYPLTDQHPFPPTRYDE